MIPSPGDPVNDGGAQREIEGMPDTGHELPNESDELLMRGLGDNLGRATVTSLLYLAIVAAVVATVTILVA